jgi:enterochelin esterase-like enzyme
MPLDEMTGNIKPYVEATFRVSGDREKRTIGGFSRGGGQSLFTGFNNLEKFAWIGSYSGYVTPEVLDKYFASAPADPQATNKKLKLLWLGAGKADFLYQQAVTFDDYLKAKKTGRQSLVTEGGHTWMNARHYLSETLRFYFK